MFVPRISSDLFSPFLHWPWQQRWSLQRHQDRVGRGRSGDDDAVLGLRLRYVRTVSQVPIADVRAMRLGDTCSLPSLWVSCGIELLSPYCLPTAATTIPAAAIAAAA